jgi:energy-coupling factor transporter ATP-binding protein EcfA2
VGDALWYTARLRLPPDLGGDEVEACIDDTLGTVSLQQRRATRIRHLSGGQVKRASLANEILTRPSLLFLDEVTSGLDEQTDRDMMNLFRSMADTGKTVVCITHSLANVERTCHLVVILTAGGRLALVGKPSEALEYFDIQRLGDVYERLAQQPVEHWQKLFKASPLYRRYVIERLPEGGASPTGRQPVSRPGKKAPHASAPDHPLDATLLRHLARRLPGAPDHAGAEHRGGGFARDTLRPVEAGVQSVKSDGPRRHRRLRPQLG